VIDAPEDACVNAVGTVPPVAPVPVTLNVTVATVFKTKSFAVAEFVFPAVSATTPSAILKRSLPAVFAVPDEFVAVNVYIDVEDVVRLDPIVQPVDAASLVISLINNPLTASLKVAVIVKALV
jgi:hypothetical protein